MWKALICDDNPAHGEELRSLLVQGAQLHVSCVGSVEELEAYTKHQYTFYEFGFWALVEKKTGAMGSF